jgi:hypothetical protein
MPARYAAGSEESNRRNAGGRSQEAEVRRQEFDRKMMGG